MKVDDDNDDKYTELVEELECRSHETSGYSRDELEAFLKVADSVPEAASNVIFASNYKAKNPVTIADVAPFLRAPPGDFQYPEACYVCLEDMKGDCARDKEGRPIILHIGMPHGTAEELKKMCAYSMMRAMQYVRKDVKGKPCCIIMEVQPREKGQKSTFRIPDAATRSTIDFAKVIFPESQYGTMHFCGLPFAATMIYSMCRLFMPAEAYNRLNLYTSFAPLADVIDDENRLPQWDNSTYSSKSKGTFHFDFDEYVEWRAREEGVSVVGRGEGRLAGHANNSGIAITDVVAAAADETTDGSTSSSTGDEEDAASTASSAASSSSVLTVLKHGRGKKRGSGSGLFKTHQWKEKYIAVLGDGVVVYFDSTNTTNPKNYASRVIRLNPDCQITVEKDSKNSSYYNLSVSAEQRQFLFGFTSLEEANEWMQAIQEASQKAESQ